jgi:hypothetical protein
LSPKLLRLKAMPPTPLKGACKYLFINKSPLGVPIAIGIGVADQKRAFETASLTPGPSLGKGWEGVI